MFRQSYGVIGVEGEPRPLDYFREGTSIGAQYWKAGGHRLNDCGPCGLVARWVHKADGMGEKRGEISFRYEAREVDSFSRLGVDFR